MKTCLAFSGAGAKVIYESGNALAWQQSGLQYDAVIGTSSGAITAAFLHAGQVEELVDVCLKVRNKDIYSLAPWKLMTKDACVLDNAPLRKLLKSRLDTGKLRMNPKKCIVNATDTRTWKAKSFELSKLSPDAIIDAIVASTSVPVAFPRRNGLIDGGTVDNYPIMDAVTDQVDRIILFTPSMVEPIEVKNALGALNEFISITLYSQMLNQLRAMAALKSHVELVVIQPQQPVNIGLLDFSAIPSIAIRREVIDAARRQALARLKLCRV